MKTKTKVNPSAHIVISFIVLIFVGTFLLCLPISSNDGKWFSFVDSLFTSTSAVSVTGLSVVGTATHFSLFGQIVILLLIQIGGIGFVSIASIFFVLIGKKLSFESRLTIQESLNQDKTQGIISLVKKIVILSLSIEAIGFACLAPSFANVYGVGNGLFKALFMSISSFCNSGFDVLGTVGNEFASLSSFAQNILVLLPMMLLIVIGGIGFVVLVDIGRFHKNKKIAFHTKIVLIATLILIFAGAFAYVGFEWNNPETLGYMTPFQKIYNAFFQSITSRTAGFSAIETSYLTNPSIIVTCLLMFIGGSPASTAGGIKTTTFVILLLSLFKRTNANGGLRFCKRNIESKTVKKSFKIFCGAVLIIVLSSFLICAFEGSNITISQGVFECVSAITTTGLSLGITPILSIASKILLSVVMFVGRVGVITFMIAITNKMSVNTEINYPDSKIIVG